MGYTPHILVIGGGVLGTGIARDFAIRGLDVTLVERGTIVAGAVEQMQGLLYSGARLADTDPRLARRMLAENRTLREIASNCVEATDGLLVTHRKDGDDAFERALTAGKECEIPVDVLDGEQAREVEPGLSGAVDRAMRVPDTVVDPLSLTIENAKSAREYGAEIRTHTAVTDITVDGGTVDTVTIEHDPTPPGADGNDDESEGDDSDHPQYKPEGEHGGPSAGVPGALVPGRSGQTQTQQRIEELEPDYVVNASGAQAGNVAALAGIDLSLGYSKETVVVAHGRHVDIPITRFRDSPEANTVVPDGDSCLLGTTDRAVGSPDDSTGTADEIDLLLDEMPAVVPAVRDCRVRRSDCWIRSWYGSESDESDRPRTDGRAVDHEFTVLDHGDRDDCWGMSTVVGGSLTTHRFVAERVADDVCRKFGITRECRTDEISLPGTDDETRQEPPGAGTHGTPNPVVCECQSVSRQDVREALSAESGAELDLNEIRIRTTASMGECQGGRCAHRLAVQLYPDHDEDTVEDVLVALLDDRWQGQRLTLWGEQLGRAMSNYAFHVRTLNRKGRDVDFLAEQPDHTGATEEGPAPSSESFRLAAFDDGPMRGTERERPQWGERSV